MNLKNLQIKIADVLGVSSSQKELAYDTFIDKVMETLHEGLTLKVPRIGFFQLKAADFHNGSNRSIIYSALSEDFDRESRNFYLTINVKPKTGNTTEFDANVFSIGVGKPLLPLTVDEMPDSESSYVMLRKSIEERAREIISESDQIPNFDLFEGYSDTNEESRDDEDINFTLSSLTSDLDIVHVEEQQPLSTMPADENLLNSLVSESGEIDDNTNEQNEELHLEDEISDAYAKEFGHITESGDENEIEYEKEIDQHSEKEPLIIEDGEIEQDKLNEQLPELSLAELLGSAISDIDEQREEKSEEAQPEDEQPSYSINEYLAQEEIPAVHEQEAPNEEPVDRINLSDTVNIETFLQQEVHEPTEKFTPDDEFDSLTSIIEEEEKIDTPEPEEIEEHKEVPEETNDKFYSLTVDDEPEEENVVEPESDESENQDEVFGVEEKPDLKKDLFADLGNKIEELKLSAESEEEGLDVNSLIEDNDFGVKEEDLLIEDENHDEKIEWNWGDELKEEFGVNRFEGEDAKFEMVDDKASANYDEPISNNKLYKDLFSQLERTIEKEKTIFEEDRKSDDWRVSSKEDHKQKYPTREEEPKRGYTEHDERPTNKFANKDDEKVFLEFSNPPTKYEFVAAKEPEQGRRMSVVLDDEPPPRYTNRQTYSGDIPPVPPQKPVAKDNYFGKIFILIFSAFVIISASIYFLLRNNSQQKNAPEDNPIVNKTKSEQSVVDSIIQAQIKNSNVDSSRIGLDDFDNFPTTAKPPVPIKSGNLNNEPAKNAQINNSEVLKTNVESNNKKIPAVVNKPTNVKNTDDNSLYRTLGTDTRVNKTIYYDGSNYNFQTSSWRNRDKAEQEAKRLRKLGFKAFIVSAYLPQKGGTWYRVRIGSFNSQSEAQDFMNNNNF